MEGYRPGDRRTVFLVPLEAQQPQLLLPPRPHGTHARWPRTGADVCGSPLTQRNTEHLGPPPIFDTIFIL